MYYNMRVHTAQRNLGETRLSLMERKKTMLQLPEDCIRTLNHALKSVCTIHETCHKLFISCNKNMYSALISIFILLCLQNNKKDVLYLPSLNVSCRLVARSPPAPLRTDPLTWLKGQSTEVT